MTILILPAILSAFAQNPVLNEKQTWTETVTKTTDENLSQIITIEFKERGLYVSTRITWTRTVDGKSTRKLQSFTPGGTVKCTGIEEFDADMHLLSSRMTGTPILSRNPDGSMGVKIKSKDPIAVSQSYHTPAQVQETERIFKKEMKNLEEHNSMLAPEPQSSCSEIPRRTCIRPKAQLFAGYSVLSADFGAKREFFPLGAQAALVINITRRIGVGPDISIHTKKIDDQTITRMFFLDKAQYNFGSNYNPNDTASTFDFPSDACLPKVVPDFHVYIGYSTERSVIKIANDTYKSSGSGFTFGAGVGVQFKLSNSIGLGAQVDYLATKFKESDEISSDVRASAGVFFNMGNVAHELKFGRAIRD